MAALVSGWAGPVQAADDPGDAERAARAIIDKAVARGEGYGDMTAVAEMVITNSRGKTAVRKLRISALEMPGDAGRSLTVVEAPPDVRGIGLLTHTNDSGEDEQWLYLPALKRVKRIASSRKSGPFMGSEFSYEDFSGQPADRYHFRLLRDEACGDQECHVIERRPKDADSGYSRQLLWMDSEHLRIHRVEYYDRRDNLLKTLVASDFERHRERWWRAARLHMVNHQTDGATTLLWSDIEFGRGLDARDFDLASLKASR